MLTRQQIIKTIRDLHRREEPLNISAVKRAHPELIQAVYAVKPFWGWKHALQDTGIGYANIKVELQETITCALCGKFFRNLATHLIKKHEVRPDEYLNDYPDSDLQSEKLRAEKMVGKTQFLRHWEPVWSREYILDRLAEYHRQGYSIIGNRMVDVDMPLTAVVYRYIAGANAWAKALIAIGHDPNKLKRESYRQTRIYSDGEDVIQGIKRRLRKRISVHSSSLQRGEHRDVILLIRGTESFGSWNNALKVAGLDPSVICLRIRGRYPSKSAVIAAIKQRYRKDWPLSVNALRTGDRKFKDIALWYNGKKYFGSWRAAMLAAGIDLNEFHKKRFQRLRRYPDSPSVIREIRKRHRSGLDIRRTGVDRGKHVNQALGNSGIEYFGSWDAALKAAGFDPKVIAMELYKRRYPDRQAVISAIKGRVRMRFPVNPAALWKGERRERTLYRIGRKLFGSWDAALKAAGLDPV